MQVRELMTTEVVTAAPDTKFDELVELMIEHDVSAVPIVDGDELVGIVSEADLVSKEAYGGRRRGLLDVLADLVAGGETRWAIKGRGRTAVALMSTVLVTSRPSESVRDAARHMVENRVKRLPVVEDDRLVGIVSRSDLMRALHLGDDEIAAAIAAMLADPLRAPDEHDVSVDVTDGIVTLSGTVLHPSDDAVIRGIAWEVPAVVDVVDQLTAREPEPHPVGS